MIPSVLQNPQLTTHLIIPGARYDERTIAKEIKQKSQLTNLDISSCTALTSLQAITRNLWDKQLVYLNVSDCKNPQLKPEDWMEFVQIVDFSNLKVLNLSNISCDFTSEEPLPNFADVKPSDLLRAKIKTCKQLQILII